MYGALHDGNYRWLKHLDGPDFHMFIQITDVCMTVMEKVCHKTFYTTQPFFDQTVVCITVQCATVHVLIFHHGGLSWSVVW